MKRQYQLNSWLKGFGFGIWFHARGNPDQSEDYIFDETNHMLTLKVKDNYESLSAKMFAAFSAVRATYKDVTHILKTDDDMKCHLDVLKVLLRIFTLYDYGGFIVNNKTDYMSTYHYHSSIEKKPSICKACQYANGRFYFLSTRAVDHILLQKERFFDMMYEDNAVGFCVQSLPDLKILYLPDKLVFEEY